MPEISRSFGWLIAISLFASPLVAQVDRLRDALPADTVLYVSTPDLRSSLREMQALPLLRMWRETEVQDFLAGLLKKAGQARDEVLAQARGAHERGELPVNPDELMKMRLDGAALALTGIKLLAGGKDVEPQLGLVLCLDCGDSASIWRNVVTAGLDWLQQQAGEAVRRETTAVGDTELLSLIPDAPIALNVAFVGNSVILGTLREEMKHILERMQSGDASLTSSPTFANTFARLDRKGAELEVFFQPGPLLDFGMDALRLASEHEADFPSALDVDGIGRVIDALGLRSIQAIGATSAYEIGPSGEAGRSVSKVFALSPASKRKGLFASGNNTLDRSFLKWVPKDVASFTASTFDMVALYDGLVDALKAYNEELAAEWMGKLSTYEQQFGVSIKDDLFGAIGDEVIMWSMPVAAIGSPPEMTVLLKVRDQERLLKALQKIAELSHGAFGIDQTERRGMVVHQVHINIDPTGGRMAMNPFDMISPTFAFKNGYLVAGFSTGDVRRAFKRMEREDDPSGDIRSNPELKQHLEQLPERVSAMSFSDWKANFEGMYQVITGLAAFIPVDEDVPVDLSLLPEAATLTKHLFCSFSWTTSDEHGWQSTAIGPWGPETVVPLVMGVAAIPVAVLGRKVGVRVR